MGNVYCPSCQCWIVGEQQTKEPIVQCVQCGAIWTKVELEQFSPET